MPSANSESPIAVDLFCGAGGLSTGLMQAGFNVVCGLDSDPHAAATYKANHPNTLVITSDISKVKGSDLRRAADGKEIDLVAGGPSCQGYSTHGKRIENDPRNFLFREFVRIVDELRPKCFILENVKGLLTYRSGYFAELIQESFSEIGYRLDAKVLCAADYGVPQMRHRIFFIGTRVPDTKITFPNPTHAQPECALIEGLEPYVTVGEALGDLPLLGGEFNNKSSLRYMLPPENAFQRYARQYIRSEFVTLHIANPPSPAALEVISLVAEGNGLRSIPIDLLPERFKKMRRIKNGNLRKDCTTLYHRLSRNAPAYTITCNFRNVASGPFVHPLENRSLSYREAARLMSFQDRYEFIGPGLPRQIGNAVPPLLAKAVGLEVHELIESIDQNQKSTSRSNTAA